MIIREGRLLPNQHHQLGKPNPYYDTTDIPYIVDNQQTHSSIEVSNCYVALQYRQSLLRAKSIILSSFVNDGISAWGGNFFSRYTKINHDLPFFYDGKNHSDCIQFLSMNPRTYQRNKRVVQNVHFDEVEFHVSGKGSKDKGHFMLTEPCHYRNFHLFTKGFKLNTQAAGPAFDANVLQKSSLGSASFPLDNDDLQGRTIRIMTRKPDSPQSFGNVIHAYRGVKIELDSKTRKAVVIRYYNKSWSEEARLENWAVYCLGFSLFGKGAF